MVQQRVPFAGRTVASDGPAVPGRTEKELEQFAFDLQHLGGESLMPGYGMQARGFFLAEQVLHALRRLSGALLWPGVHAQRAAMRCELVDINHAESGGRQGTARGQQGKVGEMLMIDRVVLPLLHQWHEVREFKGNKTIILHQRAQALSEPPNVRNMSKDIVGYHEIGMSVTP